MNLTFSNLNSIHWIIKKIYAFMYFSGHSCNPFCKPSSLSDAFILAHPDYYPNIREIFHILLTMPIESVPCERSFSALSRLKQWNRTAMVEDILSGLALLHSQRRKC